MFRVLLILLLYPAVVSAQLEITWGIPEESTSSSRLTGIIGYNQTHFFCARRDVSFSGSNGATVIEKVDADAFKTVKTHTIAFDLIEKAQFSTIGTYCIRNQIYVLGTALIPGEKEILFVGQVLDSDFNTVKPWKILDESEYAPFEAPGKWSCTLASDSSAFLVHFNKDLYALNDDYFDLFLIDLNMDLKWTERIPLEKENEYGELFNFKVDAQGNVYFLAIQSPKIEAIRANTRRHETGYVYYMCRYDPETKGFSQTSIDLGGKLAINVVMQLDSAGNPLCSGFFSEAEKHDITGAFFHSFDRTGNALLKRKEIIFPENTITQRSTRPGTTWAKDYYECTIKSLVLRKDGSATLIAEQSYVLLSGEHTRNDIILVSLLGNFNDSWVKTIPLAQKYALKDYAYISFAVITACENIILVYNEHETNYKKSTVTAVTVMPDGKMSTGKLFSGNEAQNHLQPRAIFQKGPGQIIFMSDQGKKNQFGKITCLY